MRRGRVLLALALVLTAFNLRPAISGLGPVLAEVRDDLGMSATVAGLLTSVPALCFAVFGVTAPRLAGRFGAVRVVLAGLVAISVGLGVRAVAGDTAVFLATSTLALAGIAVGNVLMPVLVRRFFADRVGLLTGLYSMGMALGTAGAAALTIPVSRAFGGNWRYGLAAWAALAVLALLFWLLVPGRSRGGAERRAGEGPAEPGQRRLRLTRSPTAWALGVFFGLQATAAYVTMGWLPQIYRDAGVPASEAGMLLALVMGLGAPLSFLIPTLATRMRGQGPLVLAIGLCGFAGYLGLWLAPAGGAWAWAVLLGIANTAFTVALTMIGLRARTGAGVIRLSAFAQSVGYLLSVPGPLLVGALNEATGGWSAPLLLLGALLAAQVCCGVLAGRDRCVEDDG
ncbi:MFS transporter, CP family, cyanate transporter [Streptomyces zhaozhouensis]|uniref:MFS transporter, CP family, cyanate transporter n=2 Tax=Streptomyces zhaozhouensis TaxID=1300267 RepID=A0A286DHQ8_9ACTN|nr:MFS transporter, CP family, cyanate transporter [Streptomyces zhaozhouensis]